MRTLSYSTLNLVYEKPHLYLNKAAGIPQPNRPEFENGKKLHRIIQDHLSGKVPCEDLKHIIKRFKVVEEVDFDPHCKISFDINASYSMTGFVDGRDEEWTETAEIKTGSFSLGKFYKSMQRKIYNTSHKTIKENYFISSPNKLEDWQFDKPKMFSLKVQPSEYVQATDWILEGIYRIEHIGDFMKKELEITNGKCTDPFCWWGELCLFK